MSRMLSKMNLISVVQQLPKDDIETIQGYVEMIEEENQQLKNDINKLQKELNEENLQCSKYSIEFNNLKEKNKQLKDNWNMLKVYIKTEIPEDVFIDTEWFVSILDKMQELEQGRDSND